MMQFSTLTWDEWESLSIEQQTRLGHELAQQVGEPFVFTRIHTYQLGEQEHRMAVFLWNLMGFVFIPGGQVTLGYDPAIATLSPAQYANWQEETFEDFSSLELDAFLARYLTPKRQVHVPSLLVEAISQRLGVLSSNEWRSDDGGFSFEAVQRLATHSGFRLPGDDEWEYACSGRTRTLFHWGNDCPLGEDDDPITISSRWRWHRKPNAFGLEMPHTTYDQEYCREAGWMRGGDGGTAMHCGAGTLAAWIPLATAYYQHIPPSITQRTGRLRRVLDLP